VVRAVTTVLHGSPSARAIANRVSLEKWSLDGNQDQRPHGPAWRTMDAMLRAMRIGWVALAAVALPLLACGGQADDGGRQSVEPGTMFVAAGTVPQASAAPVASDTSIMTPASQAAADAQFATDSSASTQPVGGGAPVEAFAADGIIPDTQSTQPDTPPEVKTTTLEAAAIDSVLMECRFWLDVTSSPLRPQDVVVHFGEQQFASLTSATYCEDLLAWALYKDPNGTWLSFCPASCDEVRASPQTPLTIEATYWTDSKLVAR